MTDRSVVIVGGGPAGAATSLSLAEQGVKSMVLEASESAERKVGETVPPALNPILHRLGLADLLREPDHLLCYGNEFLWGDDVSVTKHFLAATAGNGWHLDREKFERDLRSEAEGRGVEWCPGSRLMRAERLAQQGWRLVVEAKGEERELEADFLVDATGRASRVARLLGEQRRRYDRLIGVVVPIILPDQSSANDAIPQLTCIEAVERGWWYGALLPGNVVMTAFMTDTDLLEDGMLHFDFYRTKLAETRLIAPSLLPSNADLSLPIHSSTPIVRPASTSHLPRLYGDGWLAVGDAACAYDPLSSYGILSSIGSGIYAGQAIADHQRGKPEALPAYAVIVGQAYEAYLEMSRNQYRLEGRWPESPFWKRRR